MALYERPGLLEVEVETLGKSKEEYMNENSFAINLVPNPKLVELFEKHNISRRGKYSWSLTENNQNKRNFIEFYKEYQEIFTPYTLLAGNSDQYFNRIERLFHDNTLSQPLAVTCTYFTGEERIAVKKTVEKFFSAETIRGIPLDTLKHSEIKPQYVQCINARFQNNNITNDFIENFSPFFIIMELKTNAKKVNTLYFKLKMNTQVFIDSYYNCDYYGQIVKGSIPNNNKVNIKALENINAIRKDLDSYSNKKIKINELLYTIKNINYMLSNIYDENSIEIIDNLKKEVQNKLYINNSVSDRNQVDIINANDEIININRMKINPYGAYTTNVKKALDINKMSNNIEIVTHPSLFDLQNMINAKEYKGEKRLYSYQRRAVGLQLSTNIGLVNALDTGIGKSIVQLTAMRVKSQNIPNYRGLIVCQSNTVKQWKEYILKEKWFPEANVAIVNSGSKKVIEHLIDTLSLEGPVVVICTYNMISQVQDILDERQNLNEMITQAKTLEHFEIIRTFQKEIEKRGTIIGDLLVDAIWDDICADEATCIRNNFSSKQSLSMWHVRGNSTVATALTATPFNKSITDIERLLSWVRNDKRMFYGASLEKTYDIEKLTEKDAIKIYNNLYPMVYRYTKEEAQDEEKGNIKIPVELEPQTILLKPSAEELALSNACEYELKRIIKELEDALENFEAKTDAEKEEVDKAREELKNAHGHWLAGTNVARMATSNPASILKSNSIAAQLLISQGLVQSAIKQTPTKQKELLTRVTKNVQDGKQVLVFTDFVDVAKSLCECLENAGIKAGVFGGSNLKKRDENRIAFQEEKLDVLVCTKAAERGLTLHKASVTYHYDMSWTLEPLLQKAGRAVRVGSDNESVETYFMILEGTIEEKVVKNVFAQGTLSNLVLDRSRGVDAKKTTTGKLMGGLMTANTNINTRKGALEFGKTLLGTK